MLACNCENTLTGIGGTFTLTDTNTCQQYDANTTLSTHCRCVGA